MNWISFTWTTPALLAGRKTRTRRQWKLRYAQKFHAGDLVTAYNKSPRIGGKPVAIIRLTKDPYWTNTHKLTDVDWEAEGFAYLSTIGATINGKTPSQFWDDWIKAWQLLSTIDFELVEIL